MREIGIALLLVAMTHAAWADDNIKLREIMEADQADRRGGPNGIDWTVVRARDAQREKDVLQIIRAGGLTTSPDYFNAALVFQHADSAEDIDLAHSLATIASRMETPHPHARWLAAAAMDRLLMRKKKPQWYGTQFVRGASGKWELYTIDETAVTDEERERQQVPRLDASRAQARKMNGE